MKATSRQLGQGWKTLYIDNFECQILSFNEPSIYGINEGRISKLYILDIKGHKCVCNYDRGWDILPTDEAKKAYNTIIKKYN